MKKHIETLFLVLSLFVLYFTSCKNIECFLTYDSETGYNLYDFIGETEENILFYFKRMKVEPIYREDISGEGYKYFSIPVGIFGKYGKEALIGFYEYGTPKHLRLFSYSENMESIEWPTRGSLEGEQVIKAYKKRIDLHGEPKSVSPTMGSPDSILSGIAERSANWNIDKRVQCTFAIGSDDGRFGGVVKYIDYDFIEEKWPQMIYTNEEYECQL